MREELKDLYFDAVKDISAIAEFRETKNRIAPQIIIDEILKNDELEKQNVELKEDLHSAEDAVRDLMDEYDKIERENKNLKKENNELKEKLEESVSDVEILGQDSIDDNYTIEKLKKENGELKKLNYKLKKENEDLITPYHCLDPELLMRSINMKSQDFKMIHNKLPNYLYINQSIFNAIKENITFNAFEGEELKEPYLMGMEVIIIKGDELHIGVS